MKTRFKEFLNEYGGPGRTIGFRYSKPTLEYGFKAPLLISDNINIDELKNNIQEILKNNNIQEDYYEFDKIKEFSDKTLYGLEVSMKAYSKYELNSMIGVILNKLTEIYNNKEDFDILYNNILFKGPDSNQVRKIGFLNNNQKNSNNDLTMKK